MRSFSGDKARRRAKPLPIAGPQGIGVGRQMLPALAIGEILEGIFQQCKFVGGLQGFQSIRNALELSLNFAPITAGFEAIFHGDPMPPQPERCR